MNPYVLGGGAVVGAGLLYTLLFSGGTRRMTLPALEKIVTVFGVPTYLHVPAGASDGRVVVYMHGHGNTLKRGPALSLALQKAKNPPVLLMPQLGPKSEPGDLSKMFQGWLETALREAGITSGKPSIQIVSHSGGYNATADAISQVNVSCVALLDSLYGRYQEFLDYAQKPSTKCFVDIYGPSTSVFSERLQKALIGYKNTFVGKTSVAHDLIPEKYLSSVVDTFEKT